MKTRRRTELIFERDRTIFYSSGYPQRRLWCGECAAEVEMITTFEAAKLMSLSSYTIQDEAREGRIHHAKTNAGVILVCLNSLLGWQRAAQ